MELQGTATSPLLRRLNAGLVLGALRASGPMTVTELMTATQLSRPTVHAVADALVRLGLVHELGGDGPGGGGRRGRPARRYAFRADAGYVLGVDIGAHKVVVMAADLQGGIVAEERRTFTDPNIAAQERLAVVRRTALAALTSAGIDPTDVMTVCVGCSATVDTARGTVTFRSGIPGFLGCNVRAEMERGFGWPVVVENDCNLAAIGERWRGVAADADHVIVVLAGERLGAGIIVAGQLVRGHAGGAGEMGFLSLIEQEGGAEGVASLARTLGAEAVARMAAQRVLPDNAPTGGLLRELVDGDPRRVDAEAVFAAARAGDPVAVGILDRILTRVARAVGTMALLLDPELIVIGGGVAGAGDVLIAPLRRKLTEMTPAPPRVEASTLGDRVVAIGALRLALDHVEPRLLEGFDAA